jgi:hypothetical protein
MFINHSYYSALKYLSNPYVLLCLIFKIYIKSSYYYPYLTECMFEVELNQIILKSQEEN